MAQINEELAVKQVIETVLIRSNCCSKDLMDCIDVSKLKLVLSKKDNGYATEIAGNGYLTSLKWMASFNPPILPTTQEANYAAFHGHLNVLQWMNSLNPPILPTEESANSAAFHGHLNVLQWMASLNPPILPTN